MKSKLVTNDVETRSLLMVESLNNCKDNTTNLFFKTHVTSNFTSSSSLDDELELFEWYEEFSI